jgi:hypothetical protein
MTATLVDILGLFCWMHRSELISKLQAMIAEGDGAISQEAREVEEARIGGLLLEISRKEAACILACRRPRAKLLTGAATCRR